jgi:putative transposase
MLQDILIKSSSGCNTKSHGALPTRKKIEGLNLRSKRPRRSRSGAHRIERVDAPAINRAWSIDFLQYALFNGQRFRILAIIDNYSKKCLSLLGGKFLRVEDVRNALSQVCKEESCFPERIQCDNGSEFISKEVDRWAYENQVTLDFSRAGTPTDIPYVEVLQWEIQRRMPVD